jgi:hypothetical protein
LNSGAYSETIVEGLSFGASWQQEALIATPQSCGIAVQQSSCECAPLFDRHAKAGAAVQKRIATNINNELLLRKFISGANLPLRESSNSVPPDSDLHHPYRGLNPSGNPSI